MKKLITNTLLLITILSYTGCAVKQTDSTIVKGIKHITMTPIYASEIITLSTMVVVTSPLLLVKKLRELDDNN